MLDGMANTPATGPVPTPPGSSPPPPPDGATPPVTPSVGGGFLLEPTGSARILTPEMLTDEQRMMKETAEDFMRREVEPRIAEIEEKKPGLMREILQKAGEVGLLGHDVPEAYGGLGGDKTSSSLIFEAISRLGSFAVSFGAHVGIGTMPIVLFGTPEQRQKYLPRLATRRADRGLRPDRAGLGLRRAGGQDPGGARPPTARPTACTAPSSTSPTPASPTCSPCSPRWTARSSPASSSSAAPPA